MVTEDGDKGSTILESIFVNLLSTSQAPIQLIGCHFQIFISILINIFDTVVWRMSC